MKLVLLLLVTQVTFTLCGRVDPLLELSVKSGHVTEAILQLPQIIQQVKSSPALQSLTGDARVSTLITMLTGLTSAAQAPYLPLFESLGLTYEQFWASNIILIKGLTPETLFYLGKLEGDFELRVQKTVSISPATKVQEEIVTSPKQGIIQWGVNQIRAPAAWNVTRGEGTVACVIDTGVHLPHIALSSNYAGGWADPYYSTMGPTDNHGHGTHCMGTILGTVNGVGVAPGAQWIACRGLDNEGSGTEAALTTCAQFVLTNNPRPNVVSCSWGGGSDDGWYGSQVAAWRLANIIPVFAIGNSGSACRTGNSPGDQPDLIGVGATTTLDAMATFSSRGAAGPMGMLKPDFSAPGENILSCGTAINNYVTMSGTSMATPHLAGAVCLILSANSSMTYDEVYDLLGESAARPYVTPADKNCGLYGGDFPNNAFGWGRIDVGRALGK